MRTAVYILLGVFTVLFQVDVIPSFLSQTSWQPDLILTWVIVVALLKGRYWGVLVAAVGGLTQDIIVSNVFGLHLFPYLIIAYVFSMANHSIFEEQWYYTFLWTAAGTVAVSIMQMVMLILGGEVMSYGIYLWTHCWTVLWINGLFGIVLHELIWHMTEKDEYIW